MALASEPLVLKPPGEKGSSPIGGASASASLNVTGYPRTLPASSKRNTPSSVAGHWPDSLLKSLERVTVSSPRVTVLAWAISHGVLSGSTSKGRNCTLAAAFAGTVNFNRRSPCVLTVPSHSAVVPSSGSCTGQRARQVSKSSVLGLACATEPIFSTALTSASPGMHVSSHSSQLTLALSG